MSLLKSFFGGGAGNGARREDDQVWMTDAARTAGVRKAAERLRGERQSVVVVVQSPAQAMAVGAALVDLQPGQVTDVFSRLVLTDALSAAGRVVVAAAKALPTDANAVDIPVAVLAWGRAETRAADEAVAAFADRLGARASVTFHLSLEDPLLKVHTASLRPLLQSLKMPEDEPLVSPMVSRAVENAQRKNAK